MSGLRVLFGELRFDAIPGQDMLFGRGSGPDPVDVALDPSDRQLSNVAGAFVFSGDSWLVQNLSRRAHVRLSVDGVEVPPHLRRDLEPPSVRLGQSATVLVHVGTKQETTRTYRLEARLIQAPRRTMPRESDTQTPPRRRRGTVSLTHLEHVVLVALCSQSLELGEYAPLTDRQIADLLRVAGHGAPSRVAVSHRLDSIREKLRGAGELDFDDAAQGNARSRPMIVRWALTTGPAVYGPITRDDVTSLLADRDAGW